MRVFLIFISAAILISCSPDKNHVAGQVKDMLQGSFDKDENYSKFKLKVLSVDLIAVGPSINVGPSKFEGIAKVQRNGKSHDVPITVLVDSDGIMYQIPPGGLVFLLPDAISDALGELEQESGKKQNANSNPFDNEATDSNRVSKDDSERTTEIDEIIGQHPSAAFSNKAFLTLINGLKTGLTAEDISEYFEVASDTTAEENFIFGEGCAPHLCNRVEGMYFVDRRTKDISLFLYRDGEKGDPETRYWTTSKLKGGLFRKDRCPPKAVKWLSEHGVAVDGDDRPQNAIGNAETAAIPGIRRDEEKQAKSAIGRGDEDGQVRTKATLMVETCLRPSPDYPMAARRNQEDGTLVLSLVVDPIGNPTNLAILHSTGHPLLDKAGSDWISQCRFAPATDHGQAVSASITQTYTFSLRD